jgi:hypothetical protein
LWNLEFEFEFDFSFFFFENLLEDCNGWLNLIVKCKPSWVVGFHHETPRAGSDLAAKYQGAVGSCCKIPKDGRISPQIPRDGRILPQNTNGWWDFTKNLKSTGSKIGVNL